MNELYHHGILGMKWGVRRYQNYDGSLTPEGAIRYQVRMNEKASRGESRYGLTEARTIPKGVKMYRTTSSVNDDGTGSVYVTYIDFDRNHYKAGYVRNRDNSKEAYEHSFTLNEDLKLPSRKEQSEVINEVVGKNKKLFASAMESFVKEIMPEGSFERWEYESNHGDDDKDPVKTYTDELIKNVSQSSPDELAFTVCQSFGLATEARQKVIDELRNRGYNAMVDEASVGGRNGWSKEDYDPLIVFDRQSLTRTGTTRITEKDEKRALKENRKVWKKMSPVGVWSAIKR